MARTVTFYKNKLDRRYLDKTAGLSNASTANGVHFLDDTELVNPVMKLSEFNENACNYVHIPSLHRYYFVTDVTCSKGYYYVKLHVDVLMSFKDSIMNQEVILKRASQDGAYNLWQADDEFKLYEYTSVRYKEFKGGSSFNPNVQNFVLCVMGSGDLEEE